MKSRGKAHTWCANRHSRFYQRRFTKQRAPGAQVHILSQNAAKRAAGALRHKYPLASAALGITQAQKVAAAALVCMLTGLLFTATLSVAWAVHYFLWGFFAASILFRIILLFVPSKSQRTSPFPSPENLPDYTILIPLYHEKQVLDDLFRAINALQYPKDRLDIKLLLEADDTDTLRAVKQCRLGPQWEVLIVPPIGPLTKPKALNAGFARACGSLITIYDAEDRPHPDQLLHAARAFAQDRTGRLGCVQAPLEYYNAGQNWLTRQFALEYAAHFHVLVPALARLGLPFPLGGTSNHFRARALHQVGAWDPYNVTEDADLGYRLSANGWRLGTITLPTKEEAVARLKPWQRQRSRWLKGYMQTLGVHLRRPAKKNAAAGALSIAATLGTAILAAMGHASFSLIMLGLLLLWPWFGLILQPADYALAATGLAVGIIMLGLGAKRAGLMKLMGSLPGAMLYWPLQSWAMAKAIIDLVKRPFHWEKTEHGQYNAPEE